MKEAVLHTQDLALGYRQKNRETHLLQENVNLKLNRGEITCLLGPNGSGKSTLIRTIAGFQKSIAGKVFIDNENIDNLSAAESATKISVVLTEQTFVGSMSVFDMVAYGRVPFTGFLGRLREKDKQIIEKALIETGIENLYDRRFFELSDGERQKVMIAKSLAQETPIILLDEPTAFLDFPSKIEILQLLRKASWDHNKTILLSTHDLNLAIRFADKVWLMGKEKPLEAGIPEDLILSGKFGEFFDREKTKFDIHTGNFEFRTQHLANIQVSGNSVAYEWLVKALQRKGYRINSEENNVASIKVIDSQFCVTVGKKEFSLGSISEVLSILNEVE